MYMLDPDRGRRRRALLRDKVVSARHQLADASDTVARDVVNRSRGQVARVQSLLTRRPPGDAHIAERVRSRFRFAVSHPRSIEVWVHDGRVTLSGPGLADELDDLLREIESVRGVNVVDNRLTAKQLGVCRTNRCRGAPRLRRDAAERWGFGGHVGAPMSGVSRSRERGAGP